MIQVPAPLGLLTDALPPGELGRLGEAHDRQVVRRRSQVLPDRHDVDTEIGEVGEEADDLVVGLAEAHHEPGLDGQAGGADRIISGHRDTHFRFLRELRAGDLIRLTGQEGSRWFEVAGLEVVDSRTRELVIEPGVERLGLVTCYPFYFVGSAPQRFIVRAERVSGCSENSMS